jgi:uncharacterized alkaline shock family protein YloU
VEGQARISSDVLGSYAADAAREVVGVRGLVESSRLRHKGVRVSEDDGAFTVELHVALDWGANAALVGRAVQERVSEYLGRMAGAESLSVDVVVDEVGPPPAGD